MFKDRASLPGYPRSLEEWGMHTMEGRPLERVEAVFVWAHNGKTYVFSGGEFWRFDEGGQDRKLEGGYPKMASLWTGVPSDPDDIISWGDGKKYAKLVFAPNHRSRIRLAFTQSNHFTQKWATGCHFCRPADPFVLGTQLGSQLTVESWNMEYKRCYFKMLHNFYYVSH